MEVTEALTLVQGGGNVALCICAIFIWRATERLARIEKGLDIILRKIGHYNGEDDNA